MLFQAELATADSYAMNFNGAAPTADLDWATDKSRPPRRSRVLGLLSSVAVGAAILVTGPVRPAAAQVPSPTSAVDAQLYGSLAGKPPAKPVVGMGATPSGRGYRLVASDGGIFAFGDAGFFGSTGAIRLNRPVVGMASTPSGNGYWMVASDGGIFAFGDARFFGSTGAIALNKPVVGMASTPTGNGYWLVASDGGIFAFGDAVFFGSTGALTLNKPIVAMSASPSGNGYRFVASDGGIFAFGDARFFGSTGAIALNKPIVGMASTPSGNGYWMAASDGGIFAFGDATFRGSGRSPSGAPIVTIASVPTAVGYWMTATDGTMLAFSSLPPSSAAPTDGVSGTLPPGSSLPSESECASRVPRSPWEPRPGNYAANRNVPASVSLPGFTPNDGGVDPRARALADRVSGNFTGTTDEIIQWASCKWGFNPDLVRAVAAQESNWSQAATGDITTIADRCQPGYSVPCPESFGLMQIKARFHRGTYPHSLASTAFNVDYALMNRRICFEGWLNWLYKNPGYRAGDEWGCIGQHWSGYWMDEGAVRYISRVKTKLDARPWLQPGF